MDWTVRDRTKDSFKTFIEEGISERDWRYAIDIPSPPFVFGAVGALVCSVDPGAEDVARLIAAAPKMKSTLEAALRVLEYWVPESHIVTQIKEILESL